MGPFYEEYKVRKMHTSQFTVIMLIRRLIMVFGLVFLQEWSYFQSTLMILLSISSLCILIELKPYQDHEVYKIEIFNEATVLVVSVFHFMIMYESFTVQKTISAKKLISQILIIALSFNMLINILSISYKSIISSCKACWDAKGRYYL